MKSRLKPSVEFSMSSIADIVFLLLIFFMLTSTFVAQAGVKVDLPQSDAPAPSKSGQNTVTITKDQRYFWNDEEILPGEERNKQEELIKQMIAEVLTDDSEENDVVRLRTDKEVTMDQATFVIAEVARNGGVIFIQTEKK